MTEANSHPVEAILRDWLDDPDLTLFCGHWSGGSMMELLPRGRAVLSGPRYDGAFSGLRELRVADGAHHVHLDLGRLTRACYLLTPSVCYGYRPSFELRLAAAGQDPLHCFGLGLALAHPYTGSGLRQQAVRRYFARVADHLNRYPADASFACAPGPLTEATEGDWDVISAELDCIAASSALSVQPLRDVLKQRRALGEVPA